MDPRGERERRVVRQMLEEYVLAKGMRRMVLVYAIAPHDYHPTVPSLQPAHRKAGGILLGWAAQGEISPRLLQLSHLPREASPSSS